jgi:O-antigen/teichoic acid export membrane protein
MSRSSVLGCSWRSVTVSAAEISPVKAGDVDDQHLSTEHLRERIERRTISGGLVSTLAQGCQLVLALVYNAVLARLLSPTDFGLVAMALTVTGFLQIFKEAGLSTATIQREDISHAQVSNLFWINLGVSGLASITTVLSAPLIAWFFHEPQLVAISASLAISFLLEGLAVQHIALLNRQMRFKVTSAIEVSSAAAGFLVGVVMAYRSWGYWSLVAAMLSTSAIRLTAAWAVLPWRPQRPTRGSGTRSLVHFGADLTLVGVVYALSRGSDGLLIGRFLGSEAIGLYSRATALLIRPMERLTAPIYAVIVPALSRLQTQPDRYRAIFLQVFEGLAIGGFFFTGVFLPLAQPLVIVVLGQKWEAAAPIFAALTLAALYLPLATAASWLYTSQGRGRELLLMASIGAGVIVTSFILGLPYGPTGVAIAYSLSGILVHLPLTLYLAGRRGPVGAKDLWLAILQHLPVCLVVLVVTWLASSSGLAPSPLPRLVLSAAAGVLAGAIAILLSSRNRRSAVRILGALNELRVA